MTTKAWLEGHQFDLADLAELLASGDVRVEHDDSEDAYHLTAPEIDNPAEINRFDIPAGTPAGSHQRVGPRAKC